MGILQWSLNTVILVIIATAAYQIRLYAIEEYGLIIHEFDPWFNFRATQYLADNGWEKFFTWFDYMSWYPLGRPVGSTIYPGMQITSVAIWNTLNSLGYPMSLNDVCCYVPCWFGVSATMFLGLMAYEATRNVNMALVATAIMAIIPAHIMRSVGGGYDNESIAMTAMMMTFFFWTRSLRTDNSWPIGLIAGLAYGYMVAVWGGYVFVLNMVGMHAAVLIVTKVLFDQDLTKVHRAFSLFYIIGTLCAIQVPVVGMAPLKSFEQLPSFFVFIGLQVALACQMVVKSKGMDFKEGLAFRAKVVGAAGGLGLLLIIIIMPTGYFGPISSRVRGLFVKHTKTGNPLVDSVAEHQPASSNAYYQNLHIVYYLAPVGFVVCINKFKSDASSFVVLYALVAYYFSSKMSRLIILLGPIASVLGGVAVVFLTEWTITQFKLAMVWYNLIEDNASAPETTAETAEKEEKEEKEPAQKKRPGGAVPKKKKQEKKKANKDMSLKETLEEAYNQPQSRSLRVGLAGLYVLWAVTQYPSFYMYSQRMGQAMSHPSLLFKATDNQGKTVIVDDYREAYWWLRDNTPADARVMAWWDYGYQIAGIANRTSIADGNTWNHEHIATLGRCLISKEKTAHKMIRHLADYVLVWTGGGGDDLAKSTHIARIANSVYNDMCGPNDPLCRKFGFTDAGPTKMMAESLIYKLHSHAIKPGVTVDPKLFQHMFQSKYGKVRIYKVKNICKKSKAWGAGQANRICDAPGSWYCKGQYPPALDYVLQKRKNFKQLEDFNVEDDEDAAEYRKEYMKNIRT